MQRWIVIGAVVMVLALGGAGFGYKIYKENRPQPIWVPLPINPQLPGDKRTEIARGLKAKLTERETLIQVSKDLDLVRVLGLPTDEAAADHVGSLVFVVVGDMDAPTGGKVPSINIGVRGKVKDQAISGKIAMRLMEDVWKYLGIKPPPQK